jgi:pimeloyl-ACP methyl ester carboxylesterase
VKNDEVEQFLRAVVGPRRRDEPRLAHALTDVEMHMVPTPHGRLAAWRVGDGPAALLVHGWEDDHTLWAPLLDMLIGRGRAVVVCDLPAHGLSEGEVAYGSEWADACIAVAAALGPVDAVVAHSAGSGPAVMAVNEGLAVDRMVLIGPAMRSGNRWLRVAERMGVSPDVAARAQAHYEARISPSRAAFRIADALPALDVDLLLVHSTDDERIPAVMTEQAAETTGCGLLLVSGVTHRHTARHPAVLARIADFLQGAT